MLSLIIEGVLEDNLDYYTDEQILIYIFTNFFWSKKLLNTMSVARVSGLHFQKSRDT